MKLFLIAAFVFSGFNAFSAAPSEKKISNDEIKKAVSLFNGLRENVASSTFVSSTHESRSDKAYLALLVQNDFTAFPEVTVKGRKLFLPFPGMPVKIEVLDKNQFFINNQLFNFDTQQSVKARLKVIEGLVSRRLTFFESTMTLFESTAEAQSAAPTPLQKLAIYAHNVMAVIHDLDNGELVAEAMVCKSFIDDLALPPATQSDKESTRIAFIQKTSEALTRENAEIKKTRADFQSACGTAKGIADHRDHCEGDETHLACYKSSVKSFEVALAKTKLPFDETIPKGDRRALGDATANADAEIALNDKFQASINGGKPITPDVESTTRRTQ